MTSTSQYNQPMQINHAIKKTIIKHLTHEIPDIELIIIFGSVAENNFNADTSDIDIAFLNSDSLSNVERWNIQEKLASNLNIDIDLVDMRQSNDILNFEITHKGQIIYKKDSLKIEQFLDSTYINYIQLNEDRAAILENYP